MFASGRLELRRVHPRLHQSLRRPLLETIQDRERALDITSRRYGAKAHNGVVSGKRGSCHFFSKA